MCDFSQFIPDVDPYFIPNAGIYKLIEAVVADKVFFPVYIYGFKAWDENDNLLCDLRPARKGVEGGLYDVVNNVFHGNGADSGTITCGEEVSA